MRKLIADRSILWGGRMYKAGEELPACTLSPVWVENGSAHWTGDTGAAVMPATAAEITVESALGEDSIAVDDPVENASDETLAEPAAQPKYGRRAAKVEM